MNVELKPWIELKIPIRSQFMGIDELKKDLEKVGSVHTRTEWSPAAGPELGLIAIVKFGVAAAASGLIWDSIKSLVRNTVESLDKLIAKNKDAEFPAEVALNLEYDDMNIVFSELTDADLAHVSKFMDNLPEHLEFLKKHHINDIEEILLIEPTKRATGEKNAPYWGQWEIRYEFGMNSVSYDAIHKKLVND